MRQLGMACLLFALSSVGYGRTAALTEFYLDPDYMGGTRDGHAATPWNNLGGGSSSAWAAINSALTAGDVTVYFSARQAGVDANQPANWALNLYRTNTSAYRLTLDGMSRYNANDGTPAWSGYSGSSRCQITGQYAISTYDITAPQNYITLRGFKVVSTGGQIVQWGHGGSHVIIENNEFTALSSATIGAGVAFGDVPGTKDLTIRNNVIHDTFGEAMYIGGHSYTVGSPTNLDGILIEGNHIYNAGRWGAEGDCIDLKAGLANVVVRNNVCHANQGGNADGISSLSPMTAQGNVVYGVMGNGISFGTSSVILKNLVYNSQGVGIYAADDAAAVQTSITGNTIYGCGSGLCLGNMHTATSYQAINNLIVNCSGSGTGGWLPSSGTGSFTIKYNDVYGNAGGNYGYPEKYFVDATDLSVDPQFVNVTAPAGADGKYFTSDDGFALRSTSPVLTRGEGGTYIGAFPAGGTTPSDVFAPSVPANPAAAALSSSQIKCSWTASTDNVGVSGYNVFRDGVKVGTTGVTSYTDSGLAASSTHSYKVSAFDAAGNVSAASATVSATTMAPAADTTAPSVPGNVAASGISSSQIKVTWTASTDDVGVAGYNVFRGDTKIATTKETSYTDSGLAASSTYQYHLTAFDAAGNVSAASVIVSATTYAPPADTTGPTVSFITPTNGETVDNTKITFSVKASDPSGVDRVEIYLNGDLKSTLYSAPWNFTLNLKHYRKESPVITVKAYDELGNRSSASITVHVQ